MLKVFSVGIQLTPEGKVEAAQLMPNASHPAITFADVVDDEIVAYTTTYSSADYLLKFEGSYYAPPELTTRIEKTRKEVGSRCIPPQAFVQQYGLDSLKLAIEQSQRLKTTRAQIWGMGCMPLDVLLNGEEAVKEHASLYKSPKTFFEHIAFAATFNPEIDKILETHAQFLAKELYKDKRAEQCQSCWNAGFTHGGQRAVLVEAFVQNMNDGFSPVLENLMMPHQRKTQDFILDVLQHPDASTIELAELPVGSLQKIRELGLTFKTDQMFAQKALAIANCKHHYIHLGYDWTHLPELQDQLGADATENLVNYLKTSLREIAQHSIESGVFWDPKTSLVCQDVAPVIRAIAEVDPVGFTQVFERLDYAHKLACVSAGFIDRSWVDLEKLPQAGLVRVLETDLGF
jgi:hypothetical protein